MAKGAGESAEKVVKDIRRRTRRRFSAEEKIRIVLEGLRGEESIATLCRREGIVTNLYYRWSKEFLEAGKKQLQGDTRREATSDDVSGSAALAASCDWLLGSLLVEVAPGEFWLDDRLVAGGKLERRRNELVHAHQLAHDDSARALHEAHPPHRFHIFPAIPEVLPNMGRTFPSRLLKSL